jgi:hypothetical protein
MVRKITRKSNPIDDFNRLYRRSYHFFLNEIFRGIDAGGIIVELMRAAENVNDLRRIMSALDSPKNSTEQEELEHWANMDSTILFVFNLMGAQLREVLKLFDKFRKEGIYVEFKGRSDEKTREVLTKLEETAANYKLAGNILHDLLIPLRNVIFHYDYDKAGEWLKNNMKDERGKNPFVRNLSPSNFSFGIGSDYNDYIFESTIFSSFIQITNIRPYLIEIGEYQNIFLKFMKSFSLFLLKRARIGKREDGWYMKYFYGYRE